MPAFLNPHFTTIDPDGNALVYVLPKQLQPSSPEGTPTTPSTLSVPENFSRAFLARCMCTAFFSDLARHT